MATHLQDAALDTGTGIFGLCHTDKYGLERVKAAIPRTMMLAQGNRRWNRINCMTGFPEQFAKNVSDITGVDLSQLKTSLKLWPRMMRFAKCLAY